MTDKLVTTIERDAAARRELEDRDKEWAAIYDACADGNGQTGFELFEKALLRAVTKGFLVLAAILLAPIPAHAADQATFTFNCGEGIDAKECNHRIRNRWGTLYADDRIYDCENGLLYEIGEANPEAGTYRKEPDRWLWVGPQKQCDSR